MRDKNREIMVEARAYYLPEQSEPALERYVFGYTITILNSGGEAARLTHRHWLITDANGKVEEVHGEGVVGGQPYFHPGESYEYSSGVVLRTPVGSMQGHYDMQGPSGEHFIATISPFRLAVPGTIN